jgi:amino acid transporter
VYGEGEVATMGTSTVSSAPIFLVLLLVGVSLWVFRDAGAHAERGRPVRFAAGSIEVSAPAVWAVGCLFLCVIFMPLYLTCRRQAG